MATISAAGATTTPTRPFLADALKTHRLYRRIFGDLPFVTDGVAVGDVARARVVGATFDRYAAQFAHRAEVADAMLWPVLAVRDEASSAVTSRVKSKRRAILALMSDAQAELAAWCEGGADATGRARAAGTLGRIHGAMTDVLDDEVTNLLPIIERDFSRTEWRDLTRATRASASRRDFVVQMGWVMDGLDAADRAAFLQSLTRWQRLSWRLRGRRRWERQRDQFYDVR